MSKSEKFRGLLVEEKRLRNQLINCETAEHRMLKKAFKCLGLKMGFLGELVNDRSNITFLMASDWSVTYCRYTGVGVETCEISFEDLFDAEDK